METPETRPLHRVQAILIRQFHLQHHFRLFDPAVTSRAGVEASNEPGSEMSGALLVFARIAVSLSFKSCWDQNGRRTDELGVDSASISSTLRAYQTRTLDLNNLPGGSSTSISRCSYDTLLHKSSYQ